MSIYFLRRIKCHIINSLYFRALSMYVICCHEWHKIVPYKIVRRDSKLCQTKLSDVDTKCPTLVPLTSDIMSDVGENLRKNTVCHYALEFNDSLHM